MCNTSKSINRIFKSSLCIEYYLLYLHTNLMRILCYFRTCNAKLPIETGISYDSSRENRICGLRYLKEINFATLLIKPCLG